MAEIFCSPDLQYGEEKQVVSWAGASSCLQFSSHCGLRMEAKKVMLSYSSSSALQCEKNAALA